MRAILILTVTITLSLVAGLAFADEYEEGGVTFEPTIAIRGDDGEHTLRCTGTALRKKFFFKVYAAAAYLDEGTEAGPDPGATYVAADAPKRIHLQMLRDVESEKIVSSIDEAFEKCATTPLEQIESERAEFREAFAMPELLKGQDIRFTWLPEVGLQISVDHEMLATIASPAFGKSFFEIYFGPDPVNDGMKKNLLELVSE
jgi:hypothetical protein